MVWIGNMIQGKIRFMKYLSKKAIIFQGNQALLDAHK